MHDRRSRGEQLSLLRESAIVVGVVVMATVAFDWTSPNSLVRIWFLPLLPGFVAGLLFSGHGGDTVVGYTTAILVNSALYVSVWLFVRAIRKGIRKAR
jgi:hypothetical protein